MQVRRPIKAISAIAPVMVLMAAFAFSACGDADAEAARDPELFGKPGYRFNDPDVELTLTAAVTEWEVYEGEVVEAWTYNGQYPGPTIRVHKGDKIRVTLENELPEATTIHWHGLDVPNDQDGVPGITQPGVEPGESWTYEFTADRVGTTAYHTHQNTLNQIGRGLFGALIVEEPREKTYDHDIVMQLHEIFGNYTINGYSFPKTRDEDLISISEGETARIRFINMGSQYHPMHLHGHQMKVIAIDGNPLDSNRTVNTVDVPPGQTVDVVVTADNPGNWVFHCHIIPHVQNKGSYPGGMLAVMAYEGYEFHFDPSDQLPPADDGDEPDGDAPDDGGAVRIASNDSLFDTDVIEATAGEELTILFENNDPGLPHNISFYDTPNAENVIYEGELFPGIETLEFTLTAPDEPGTYFFRCDVHPTTMTGDFVVRDP